MADQQGQRVALPDSGPVGADPRSERVGVFVLTQFTLGSLAAAVEPLRLANQISGRELYALKLASRNGQTVSALGGFRCETDAAFRDIACDIAIVVAGLFHQPGDVEVGEVAGCIRRLERSGALVCGVSTGARVLAKAGLLDGYRATTHFDHLASLASEFPNLTLTRELYEIDRTRLTCGGGTAAIDLMCAMIAARHGTALAAKVSDQLLHQRSRTEAAPRTQNAGERFGNQNPKLSAVLTKMEETIEAPLTLAELSKSVGVSARQLERLFARHLGHSPNKHYLIMRLERARDLLRQTRMPILSVAISCGFVSASHFAKCFQEHYGRSPSQERREARATT